MINSQLIKRFFFLIIITLFIFANVVTINGYQIGNNINNYNFLNSNNSKEIISKKNLDIKQNTINPNEFKDILKINENSLVIEDITDGLGLNILIKNNADSDITNITLNINSSNDFINIITKKIYEIPIIKSNESKNINIKFFGFCLGLAKKYFIVSINVSSPFTDSFESKVSLKILGPLVKIVAVSYNTKTIYEGYTLFTPELSKKIFLIDSNGNVVHEWTSKHRQGLGTYLLENGNVIRSDAAGFNLNWMVAGETGRVEIFDWNGTCIWNFLYISSKYCLHNDIEPLPNGNVLMIVWSIKTKEEAIAAGCNPMDPRLVRRGEVWTDTIIEVEPKGNGDGKIVWEWDVWDHLIQDYDETNDNYGVVADHPELIDINFGGVVGFINDLSITHLNSVDYNEELDQILLSSRFLGEIYVIDHSTTTEESAGHTGGKYGKGGDILYRWGNPQVYRAGEANDQKLFSQHDARWIESGCPGEGHITIFNNGVGRPEGEYSSVEEIVPPICEDGNYSYTPGLAYGPDNPIWVYTAENPTDLYSNIMSSAQRLPNGNTLICSSIQGLFFEVTSEKNIVWKYKSNVANPICSHAFKLQRYSKDYSGLDSLNKN